MVRASSPGCLWGLLLSFCYTSSAVPTAVARGHVRARPPTCNTPTNRACWTSNLSITTDYEAVIPETGITRSYTFTLTEADNWTGPDGVVKTKVMLVNGQYPGPTITADWGDRINVTVTNNLVHNGTSIHYHGIRQLNSNDNDGVPGVTECPIPPGGTKMYSFLATQYGTSWYHAHFSIQYGYGILGPIVINGPASTNYDVDLGPFMISDWYYSGIDADLMRVESPSNPFVPGFPGAPPPSDNVLINGTNINPLGPGGNYATVALTPGKLHRLRLINPSVENSFTLTMVKHTFTIIAIDFVPIQPLTVSSIYIAVGQRYDVIINANQAVDDYWFNVTLPTGPCGQSKNPHPAAIMSYTGTTGSIPTDRGLAAPDTFCADPSVSMYQPVVTRSASVASFTPTAADTFDVNIQINSSVARVFWPVNNSPINVSWGQPTLSYLANGATSSLPSNSNIVSVPSSNTTTFWLIQNNSSIPHPVHLHGHDILILGASAPVANPTAPGNVLRPYNPATDAVGLNGSNPARRDTTTLPAWGWLVVAYTTDNPGAWLFHCHTAWHVSQGLSVQFLEQPGSVGVDGISMKSNCDAWSNYYPAHDPYTQDGSGI